MWYCVQRDRLVKEFIVPLEKQIRSEQEEKQVVENETREIVGQKRRARGTGMSSASKAEMVAVGGTRRSKRVKVAPTRYAPVVEEESWTTSPHASSGIVTTRNIAALAPSPPLDESSATDETTAMNGSNENVNISSSRRVSAVAAATRANKRSSKVNKTFNERLEDLMSFKAEFGHCNVPKTK
jgi:hypothetical protein